MKGIILITLINVREELSQARVGAFHLRFAALLTLIVFVIGYDIFNTAYAIPLIRKLWDPTPSMVGFMLSSSNVGVVIGSILQGVLADRIGRRKVMLLALWILPLASGALATVVHDVWSFSLFRFILGTGIGMVMPLALTCINEWAPQRNANSFAIFIFQFGFAAGGICAGVAGIMVTPYFGWQSLYFLGALSAVVAIAAIKWLPESLQYLTLHGRYAEVLVLLRKVRPERVNIYANARIEAMRNTSRPGSIKDLFSKEYRRSTIIIWIVGALSLFCINGLTGWLPSLVIAKGQGISSAFSYGTFVMIASMFGGVAMGWLADYLASRIKAMVIGFAVTAIFMSTLIIALNQSLGMALVAATGFFIFGTQAVLNNYQAMTYRTEIRGTGMGIAVGINHIGGALGPISVGVVTSINPDPAYVFAIFSVALTIAAIAISFGRIEVSSLPIHREEETYDDISFDAKKT
jgi:AAHS family benzoate transporter-like MFS transporter/AAHS family 4-hydroxybenzoate transporter-like MFS transporter